MLASITKGNDVQWVVAVVVATVAVTFADLVIVTVLFTDMMHHMNGHDG